MKQKKLKKYKVSDLVGFLQKKAPFDFAETWDNVGLLCGDASQEVSGIVISVNLGAEALNEAKKQNANVIVCHHPPIFKPISKLTAQSSPYLFRALTMGVSVISLHTNFDLASVDQNKKISEKLKLNYKTFLAERENGTPKSLKLAKFITYVPEKNLEEVRKAICDAGAGVIGNYSHCSFSWNGEGTFLGNESTNPKIGSKNKIEKVEEKRLEVVFELKRLSIILEAARKAHPYEEMAYDIIGLESQPKDIGYGFISETSPKLTFRKFVESVKSCFQLKHVTIAGPALDDPEIVIDKVAFSPGSGSSFISQAAAKGVQVYVCGEVGYHQILEARNKNVTLVLLGHSYSERFFMSTVSGWIQNESQMEIAKNKIVEVYENIHDVM